MLQGCPYIDQAIKDLSVFLGSDTVIGHNVNFDMHFLADAYMNYLGQELTNPCIDTMRIARKILPDLQHHRLSDLATHYGVAYDGAHRSGVDCDITNACYRHMRNSILEQETEEDFKNRFIRKRPAYYNHSKVNANDIQATTDDFDPDHPLYQKTVVFTGELSQMTRAEAMQIVVNCGGFCANGVTKKTNFLVIGTSDFISVTEGKKTTKMLKAEQLRAKGHDIATISENTFFDFISQK